MGGGSHYDSWIKKDDPVDEEDHLDEPVEVESESAFFPRLAHGIKKKLKIGYKSNAEVKIWFDCKLQTYELLRKICHAKEGEKP